MKTTATITVDSREMTIREKLNAIERLASEVQQGLTSTFAYAAMQNKMKHIRRTASDVLADL